MGGFGSRQTEYGKVLSVCYPIIGYFLRWERTKT